MPSETAAAQRTAPTGLNGTGPALPSAAPPALVLSSQRAYFDLFLISFVILFFELACIRWFGSTVIFLTFFTNLVLMACFLGMSVGLLTASREKNHIAAFIPLTLVAVALASVTLFLYESYSRVSIDVGGQASPQQIYFGTEYRAGDPSRIVVPIEVIAGVFFVLIAVMFVGLGQTMGRAFNAIPNRVLSYTTDIAGSLTGIVVFAIASYLQTPPLLWFGISTLIALRFAWPAARSGSRRLAAPVQLVALAGVLLVVGMTGISTSAAMQTFWSPYYKINYLSDPAKREIITNNIGHQSMVSVGETGPAYALPHLLNRDAGQPPFRDVLIIGAGSGNDVQAARQYGAGSIDGVEIESVIYNLGRKYHPNRPYDDSRVRIHLDDGRSFLKKSQKKYDLVIYALVDSLVLHSGYSSLRLESFLFTRQAFEDVRACLKPGGMFAMYNFYRQGWVVARLAKLSKEVFGTEPLIVSLPYMKSIAPSDSQKNHITFILAGNASAIKAAMRRNGFFWVNTQPRLNQNVNAYGAQPPRAQPPSVLRHEAGGEANGAATRGRWLRIGPASVDTSQAQLLPGDDWPFLYLRERAIPALNIRGMVLVALLSLAVLLAFAPGVWRGHSDDGGADGADGADGGRRIRINWQMFFLGAGFMLLETKGVVHMALLFGSTWVVNSVVFAAILVMILLSNLFVLAARPRNMTPFYALLIAALLVNTLVPMSVFLALPGAGKVIASCAVVFVPVFFAGVIFASTFRDSRHPDVDFGSNVGGIILGGLSEYFSLVTGFNYLLFIAIAFYVLSALLKPRLRAAAPLPAVP